MGVVNYQVLLADLIKPLVSHPDDVSIDILEEDENYLKLHINVNSFDTGRIIGKKGRIANAIRTIVHAAAVREHMRVDIDMGGADSVEEAAE